ncbi:lantibiotic dehydratase [Hyalangium gracile]|uniref:lantibiotic dehydratase n=1 Tax=Hyalangium gracile TaxID=394092 RepID=UPI001CCF77BA|nr:lantibiotic dehydratase [Hyalangium gracile]
MTDPMNESPPRTGFSASGFFAVRSPVLPLDILLAWSQGLSASQAPESARADALAHDAALLRERLRRHVADPLVQEALFLASPSLVESLPQWEASPESERGQKVERTLVRYFTRMASRATPFGLFGSHSVGRLGEHTRLRLAERGALRRHVRLDFDYLQALVAQVRKAPEVLRALRYVPNSSLYRVADRLRYLETRQRERDYSYHLVAVEPSPYLEATLERARAGASLEELAAALVESDPEVALDEALSYLETLVGEQLLVPTWGPPLTGPQPLPALVESARQVPALEPIRQQLSAVQSRLTELNAAPPGQPAHVYRELSQQLEALPVSVSVEQGHLFHVEAFRPVTQATLSPAVLEELEHSLEALRRTNPSQRAEHPLELFRTRFLKRYEGRSVPLLEALDDENGVGFTFGRAPGTTTGPLLAGLAFPGGRRQDKGSFEPRHHHLLRLLESTWREGAQELVLTAEDLRALEAPDPYPLPDAFGVLGTVSAASPEAMDRGEFRFHLENAHGPSGAVYLGRFCHGDPELAGLVREHLRAEEALRPDAIFAELVHLPQGRMSNITYRPLLRRHELPFLGQSGAALDEQLPLTDLWLSEEGGRLVLRSKRLGREVIPRMTTAHNYGVYGVGVYRFLGLMQSPHGLGLEFQWGPLANASFLPRVVHGRTVFCLARWNVEGDTLRAWGEAQGAARFEAVQRVRTRMRMPRWVCVKDDDNQLLVDLDNVLCVETLVQLVKARSRLTLEELFPGPDGLCAESGDGRYVHELVIPFVRQAASVKPSRPVPPPVEERPRARQFPPGSEWLYLKLYGGTITLDRLLASTLGEALRQAQASGATDRWFFIRYNDPEPHLRLRFHGAPERLQAEVWPRLREACAAFLQEGTGWRVQLDTYERELERYGGPVGTELSEALFCADSLAVLEILQTCPADAGAELRWRLALKGMDALMDELGMTLEQKLDLVEQNRAGYGAEFHANKALEVQLGARYRRESRQLEALLSAPAEAQGPFRDGLLAFQRRAARTRPVAELLRKAEQAGKLSVSVGELASSYLHMHVNRLLPEEQRAHELVLHDFLVRLYRSRLARRKKGT